jgi:hypothetical protein
MTCEAPVERTGTGVVTGSEGTVMRTGTAPSRASASSASSMLIGRLSVSVSTRTTSPGATWQRRKIDSKVFSHRSCTRMRPLP